MELRAILIQGGSHQPQSEQWTGQHISNLEVLGKPVIEHIIDRLQRFGVDMITIVTAEDVQARRPRNNVNVVTAAPDQLWRSAESVFNQYAQTGAEIVIAQRVGPYIEFDLDSLLHFHNGNKNRVTRVVNVNGERLQLTVIEASRRNDGAYLIRNQLLEPRVAGADYYFTSYVNPLQQIADVRKLAQDALMLDCEIRPAGFEIKPGVWAGDGAEIAKDVRLVAPCYIGAGTKIRTGAVVTRMSSIERNAEVDIGTMVEDSSIMPLSYVGPGLDICHSVVGYSKISSVPRNATVAICDPKLTGQLSPSAFVRRVGGFADAVIKVVAAVIASFTTKHAAQAAETATAEHAAPVTEKSRAAAKAS
jgi:carbonic anhydrase/acetyltransferase-like protein (isoleucine patch superfamily)